MVETAIRVEVKCRLEDCFRAKGKLGGDEAPS